MDGRMKGILLGAVIAIQLILLFHIGYSRLLVEEQIYNLHQEVERGNQCMIGNSEACEEIKTGLIVGDEGLSDR